MIIAQRGEQFLIDLGEGRGQIYDDRRHKLFPPTSLDSVLARGYWKQPTRTPVITAAVQPLEVGNSDEETS